jgi:hypothetical protein
MFAATYNRVWHCAVMPHLILLACFIKSDPDPEVELQKKHQILQEVIVNRVYLGQGSSSSSPSIPELFGFGNGPKAYAKLQCAMSDYEGDPLIGQYAASAMTKLFAAAGLENLLGDAN